MIPGTLRPLPKKVKEVKEEADKYLRLAELDLSTTKEIFQDSSLYTFDELNYHFKKINDHLFIITPLVKEADKIVDKYVNDTLLSELVFKLYTQLEHIENRLKVDFQRLETTLMSKRKKHIEEMIPRMEEEIRSKLSFLKDLSFDEILSKSSAYGKTIGEIVAKLNGLREEYGKLADGSFDVSEFYGYLNEGLYKVEAELAEYDLILRTCKMQLLSEEAEKMIEEGNVINNEFEMEQSSELVLKGADYVKKVDIKLAEIYALKVNLPKKGISRDFSSKFKDLQKNFETNKINLETIRNSLNERVVHLSSQVERINGIKIIAESDGEEVYEAVNLLKIKKKGTFYLKVQEKDLPVFEISPLGKLKMPLGEELNTSKIEELLKWIEDIEATSLSDNLKNNFKTMKIAGFFEKIGRGVSKVKVKLAPAYNRVKTGLKNVGTKITESSKTSYSKTKEYLTKKTEKSQKEEEKEQIESQEEEN